MTEMVAPPVWLLEELMRIVPRERVLHRPIERIAFASDASFYRLIPKAVVFASTVEEVQALFAYSRRRGVPITFRAAGTSLSGQAVTDGILVEVARHWRQARVEDGGRKVRVKPGMIGAQVNALLAAYNAKIGPDPASLKACTVGGILANNSSGMCCGVTQNAYHTIDSLSFVLPSGTRIDTADPDADRKFRELEPKLAAGLLELRQRILSNSALAGRIREKYRMKNTTGYSLNAFIDFERAADIFSHVLIGSEGTLAFIAEAVLNTVPTLPLKYTGMLVFSNIYDACAAIVPLREASAQMLELLDYASLRATSEKPGMPVEFKRLPQGAAALLTEFQAATGQDMEGFIDASRQSTGKLRLLAPAEFTRDAEAQAKLLAIRSGLYPMVGGRRRSGTTVILEDVAFPIDRLADASVDLQRMFRKHDYDDAVIFGHAKDGNLHFLITQSVNDAASVARYDRFIREVVDVVVSRYDGALKAEHGTGRNMAPFVETEWGPEAVQIMRRLKTLCDPDNLLNPDVILNPDPEAHLKHMKTTPSIEEEADMCIECGFCEHVCPSRELTLTPRQRIVVRREMARLEAQGGIAPLAAALARDYDYQGMHTCAGDGMCRTACPVNINTGELVKRFRGRKHPPWLKRAAGFAVRHWASGERLARVGLRLGHLAAAIAGHGFVKGVTNIGRSLLGEEVVPQWAPDMPFAASAEFPKTTLDGAEAIYFPSCMSRIFGYSPGEPAEMTLAEAFMKVAGRAGVRVFIPPDIAGACCGTPWHSKGFHDGNRVMVNLTIERMWEWSGHGRLPVVVEGSSCTQGIQDCGRELTAENRAKFDAMKILDSVEFVHDRLLPNLRIERKAGVLAVHPVCSVWQMGLAGKLKNIGQAMSEAVVLPPDEGCCGFAGDRGFLHPELTQSAMKPEAEDLKERHATRGISSNRTCEIGLKRATGLDYRSYLFLLEELTRRMG